MKAATNLLLFLFFISLSFSPALAQKKNKMRTTADVLKGGKRDGKSYRLLSGNVIIKIKNTKIYCDSAYKFSNNYVEAFGHVKIVEKKDGTTITSDKLFYSGDTKMARLRENVVYEKDSITLTTDKLDYNRATKSAIFYEGGKVVDSDNVLTSKTGIFYPDQNKVTFEKNVVLVNPEYTLHTEKLHYNTVNKNATTIGYTKMVYEDGKTVISPTGSNYETVSDKSTVREGTVETDSYILSGDLLNFDKKNDVYTAEHNVKLVAKENDVIVYGDFANMNRKDGITKIYGNTLMKKTFGEDTLYLTADTLVSIDNADKNEKALLAYKNVKIFKTDLQGIADSINYDFNDSVMYFYQDPVIWTGESQMVADTINVRLVNKKVDKVFLNSRAFIISRDTIGEFDQIKGRNMIIHFKENELDKVDVNGNGESIYFLLEKDNFMTGMNRVICSDMQIRFKDSQVDNILFKSNVEATLTPPHELEEPDKRLQDFNWREEERPEKEKMIGPKGTPLKKSNLLKNKDTALGSDTNQASNKH